LWLRESSGRINRLRNEVEHEYSLPHDKERLGDFVDVVELFVSGTGPFARRRFLDYEFVRPYRARQLLLEINHALPDTALRGVDGAVHGGKKKPADAGSSTMARPGLEPGTPRFSVVCSTN
jgi:hypothetical protein